MGAHPEDGGEWGGPVEPVIGLTGALRGAMIRAAHEPSHPCECDSGAINSVILGVALRSAHAGRCAERHARWRVAPGIAHDLLLFLPQPANQEDRKSTRLNSSH